MMRSVFTSAVTTLVLCAAATASDAPAGMTTFYDAPTTVDLGGRPVIAEIALHSDKELERLGLLRMALTTDVTKFVAETEQDLMNWIAARQEDCGERWSSSEPAITFPGGDIRFAITLEIEMWTCGLNGKAPPARLARDGGSVDVTLTPFVEDGKLQARLKQFSFDNRQGLSKYLPVELLVKTALNQELDNLNQNPKFYRAPQPFQDEAFHYESLEGEVTDDGRIVITAIYAAPGTPKTLDRLVAALNERGIYQPSRKRN
jgi:hypothetical protein